MFPSIRSPPSAYYDGYLTTKYPLSFIVETIHNSRVFHCLVCFMQICGEHKNSGILKKGFYASPLLEDGVESELPERNGGLASCFFGIAYQFVLRRKYAS